MNYNKQCMGNLIKFIEENLCFENDEMRETGFNINGVFLGDFMETRTSFAVNEVKYCYYLLRNMDCLIIDENVRGNSPLIKGFTSKGCEIILKYLHK